MKRELLDQFEGKSKVTHVISDNGSESFLTPGRSFDDEANAKGACKLNTVENERKHVLFLFNSSGVEVGRYYIAKKLQGQTPDQIIGQKDCLCFFEAWNQVSKSWVPCVGILDNNHLKNLASKAVSINNNQTNKVDVEDFMGFVINATTSEQIKSSLTGKGISFREHPDFFEKRKKTISFSYRFSDIDWSCELRTEDDVLSHVVLNVFSPDSEKKYKSLCRELLERYGSTYDVANRIDKSEGTETVCFSNKEDPFTFTEIVYDSSPILGQKSIYIRYYK